MISYSAEIQKQSHFGNRTALVLLEHLNIHFVVRSFKILNLLKTF